MKTNFDNPTEEQKELIRYWIEKFKDEDMFLGSFIEKYLSPKPKIEVGKWYKAFEDSDILFMCTQIIGDECFGYGFGFRNIWNNDGRLFARETDKLIEGTYKEVAKRLIEEANRLEITEGASIISTSGAVFSNLHGEYVSNITANKLFYGGAVIFDNGKWAEIIPAKKLPAPSELEDAIKALDDATEKLKNLLK